MLAMNSSQVESTSSQTGVRIKLVQSFLAQYVGLRRFLKINRTQMVKLKGEVSSPRQVTSGMKYT